jgi:hypothetical protein
MDAVHGQPRYVVWWGQPLVGQVKLYHTTWGQPQYDIRNIF